MENTKKLKFRTKYIVINGKRYKLYAWSNSRLTYTSNTDYWADISVDKFVEDAKNYSIGSFTYGKTLFKKRPYIEYNNNWDSTERWYVDELKDVTIKYHVEYRECTESLDYVQKHLDSESYAEWWRDHMKGDF